MYVGLELSLATSVSMAGIIDMILATDMTEHFSLLGQFNAKLSAGGLDCEQAEDKVCLCYSLRCLFWMVANLVLS